MVDNIHKRILKMKPFMVKEITVTENIYCYMYFKSVQVLSCCLLYEGASREIPDVNLSEHYIVQRFPGWISNPH